MAATRERYSKIARRTLHDARVRALSAPQPNGQSLFLYCLLGPMLTNLPGLFVAGEHGLAEALGWPLKGFREAFSEVSTQGLVRADFEARLVFVPKALKHNTPESPNVVLSWRHTWSELPECPLKHEARTAFERFFASRPAFAKAFAEACPNPSANQDQEQEQEQGTPVVPLAGDDDGALLRPSARGRRQRTLAPDGDPNDPRVMAWAEKWAIDVRHPDFANWLHWARSRDTVHADWGEAWKARLASAHAPASKVRLRPRLDGQPMDPTAFLAEPEDLFQAAAGGGGRG